MNISFTFEEETLKRLENFSENLQLVGDCRCVENKCGDAGSCMNLYCLAWNDISSLYISTENNALEKLVANVLLKTLIAHLHLNSTILIRVALHEHFITH